MRYLITEELREEIRKQKLSLNKLSMEVGFKVKNILLYNKTIRKDHFEKLKEFLEMEISLEVANMNYEKNLGDYAISKNPSKFKINEDLAELIGILLGDGSLHKNQLSISFDARNKEYIQYVRILFKKIFGLDLKYKVLKNTNSAYLYYYNKKLIDKLIELELKRGHKINNRVGIPTWIKENQEYTKRCIKGLIDTDGCIYTCKREKQTYIKFTNFNFQLLKDFKELTKGLGYSFAKANKNNWCLYRKAEVARFINELRPFKSYRGL